MPTPEVPEHRRRRARKRLAEAGRDPVAEVPEDEEEEDPNGGHSHTVSDPELYPEPRDCEVCQMMEGLAR